MKNTNTHTSGCFTQSITFDYMGGKDENGLKEGFGVQKWKDGSKYSGMFKQNKASGLGIFIHPDGDKYQGEFENDRANGFGIYVHENGAIYYGQWSDDSQYDIGYEEWTDSSRYSGSYVNGKKEGYDAEREKNNPFILRLKEAAPEMYERMKQVGRRAGQGRRVV